MHRYRKNFSEVLNSSNSNQTKARFLRLFWISLVFIVVVFPVEVYVLYENSLVASGHYSWNEVHGPKWWDIVLVPSAGTVLFDRWIQTGAGFALFFFFGLGQDARAMYRKWLLHLGFGRCLPFLRSGTVSQQQYYSPSSRARLFNKSFSRGSLFSM